MNKITPAGYGPHYGPLIKREGNVFNKYGEPLADSREVAELLGVGHSRLVEDILRLDCGDDGGVFYMTDDGFYRLSRRLSERPNR
ncbi:hypothetical protein ABNF65_19175 [Paenibacillus larvae]